MPLAMGRVNHSPCVCLSGPDSKCLSSRNVAAVITQQLRDAGAAYAQTLRQAGGQAELTEGPGIIHGF